MAFRKCKTVRKAEQRYKPKEWGDGGLPPCQIAPRNVPSVTAADVPSASAMPTGADLPLSPAVSDPLQVNADRTGSKALDNHHPTPPA